MLEVLALCIWFCLYLIILRSILWKGGKGEEGIVENKIKNEQMCKGDSNFGEVKGSKYDGNSEPRQLISILYDGNSLP